MGNNRYYIGCPVKCLCGLQHSNEDNRVKLIRVIRSRLDTMSTEITWNVIIKIIEGPVVNHFTTGMKICKFLAQLYEVYYRNME